MKNERAVDRLRGLRPSAKLDGERDSELGELAHVFEAELVRDIIPAAVRNDVSMDKWVMSEFTHSFDVWMYPWFDSGKVLSGRM